MGTKVDCPIEKVKELILEEFKNYYSYKEDTQKKMILEFVEPECCEEMFEYMRGTERR